MSNITLPFTPLYTNSRRSKSRRSMSRQIYSAMRRSRSWSGPVAGNNDHIPWELFEDDHLSTDGSSFDDMDSLNGYVESLNEQIRSSAQEPFWEGIGHRPRIYNACNLLTSDIVVRFGGGRFEFYSEKAILSAKSEYFNRAFSGNFPVATSDVIDLGDEDNSKHIYAMLRFIHGTKYHTIHQRSSMGRSLDFHIDLYLIGEQFDVPSLRHAAADVFFHEAHFLADTRWFPMAAQRIFGVDAPAMADKFLIDVTVKICVEQIETLVKNKHFMEMAHAGDLFDNDMALHLFLTLGLRIRELSGLDVWMSKEERLIKAQKEYFAAEAALGPVPRSSLAGQIVAARAMNAAHTAVTNAATLVPQPTVAPPPAILASYPPPPVSHPAVARPKASLVNMIRDKVSLLSKKLGSPFRKT